MAYLIFGSLTVLTGLLCFYLQHSMKEEALNMQATSTSTLTDLLERWRHIKESLGERHF